MIRPFTKIGVLAACAGCDRCALRRRTSRRRDEVLELGESESGVGAAESRPPLRLCCCGRWPGCSPPRRAQKPRRRPEQDPGQTSLEFLPMRCFTLRTRAYRQNVSELLTGSYTALLRCKAILSHARKKNVEVGQRFRAQRNYFLKAAGNTSRFRSQLHDLSRSSHGRPGACRHVYPPRSPPSRSRYVGNLRHCRPSVAPRVLELPRVPKSTRPTCPHLDTPII